MHLLETCKIHFEKNHINNCSLCATNMKMNGFGKFFDQPSCEFGGKYMEVRGGGGVGRPIQKSSGNKNISIQKYNLRCTKHR